MLQEKLIAQRIGNRWPVYIDDVVIRTPRNTGNFGDKIEIVLEPSMAFGSGCHETTQLCIRALRQNLEPGDRVLDVGCGSGILSILAVKCGAGEVIALDIDENAVKSATRNAILNGLKFPIWCRSIMDQDRDETFNVIVANLTYKRIINLYDRLRAAVVPTGVLILSGVRCEQETDFQLFLYEKEAALGSTYLKITRQNEWLCATLTI